MNMLRLLLYSVLGFFCGAVVGTILVAFTDVAINFGMRDVLIILLIGTFTAALGIVLAKKLNAKDSRQILATSTDQAPLSNYEVARTIASYFWASAFVVFGGFFLVLPLVPRSTGNDIFDWLSINSFSLPFVSYLSLFAILAIWIAVSVVTRRNRLSRSNSPPKIACIVVVLVLPSLFLFSLSEGPTLLIAIVQEPAAILLDTAVIALSVAATTWYFVMKEQRALG
jgi:hypothetical protein